MENAFDFFSYSELLRWIIDGDNDLSKEEIDERLEEAKERASKEPDYNNTVFACLYKERKESGKCLTHLAKIKDMSRQDSLRAILFDNE